MKGYGKLNTGMNRLGFEEDEFMDIYNTNLSDKKFVLMSHLAASNVPDDPSNKIQFDFLLISQYFYFQNNIYTNQPLV